MLKIWLTQIGEQLPLDRNIRKMRTALLADELVKRGHNVTWWASAFDHAGKRFLFAKDDEVVINDHYKIRVLKGMKYTKNISLKRYHDHRIIAGKLFSWASRSEKPDIVLTSMPDHLTAYQAVRYANLHEVPVIVDVRDEWPDLFLDVLPGILRPAARCLLRADLRNTAYLLSRCAGVTSMMEPMLRWALKKAGREKRWTDRVFYLGTMLPQPYDSSRLPTEISRLADKTRNRIVLLYIGTFGKHNDPTILLQAAKVLKNTGLGERFSFLIAGDGKYRPIIEKAAGELDNVHLTGWVGQNEISFLLSLATAGVIPSTSARDEFPNKAFTYLSAGLPIVASMSGELRDVIYGHGVGYSYAPNDVSGLVSCLSALDRESLMHHEMSERARALFRDRFNAEKIYADFADHLEGIASHLLLPEGRKKILVDS